MGIMIRTGKLARECGFRLPLEVLKSNAGFYLGTASPEHGPVSRESEEYWRTQEAAAAALESGEWTQRHSA